jgi:hypothetical protein
MQTVLSPPTTLWCADGLTASIDGPGLQQTCRVDKPFLLIGSSPQADIVLPLVDFAPVALYLHVTNDAIAWLDLASPTGQWRTGVFAKSGCLVWRGYHIALERIAGKRGAEASSKLESAPLPDERPCDVPVFNIEFDGEQLARAKLASTMTLVGQSDRCRLRLRNRHVSYDHCLFYVADRRAWVIDLLSDEGTFVRGQRVSAAPIFAGDVVTIGKPTMTLRRWSESKSAIQRTNQSAGVAVTLESDLQSNHHAPHDEVSPQGDDQEMTVGWAHENVTCQIDAKGIAEITAREPASIPESSGSTDAGAAFHSANFQTSDSSTEPRPRSVADTVVESASLRDTVFEHTDTRTCKVELPPSEVRPTANSSKPASVSLQSLLPDPSLDRLIDRHKQNHRRTIVRWSVASSVILAAFLSVVVWGSRNIDFYNREPAFQGEPSPDSEAQRDSSAPRNRPTPARGFADEIAPELSESLAEPTHPPHSAQL